MQRIACDERPDWKTTADAAGFHFHTISCERSWDERAYYAVTLKEIEEDIEAPTGELDAMCRELVARAVEDERMMRVTIWSSNQGNVTLTRPSFCGSFTSETSASATP